VLAKSLIKSAKIKPRDALHVACAETGGCNYFVTCDDDLVRTVRTRRRLKLRVIAANPVEFIRRQGGSHG
jgi:predicted nucleic acid-binding protein